MTVLVTGERATSARTCSSSYDATAFPAWCWTTFHAGIASWSSTPSWWSVTSRIPPWFAVPWHHRVSAVMHFAAYASVGESAVQPLTYCANNVGGTISLLRARSRAT
jgi:GDP-mannose 4,6 dehydratase